MLSNETSSQEPNINLSYGFGAKGKYRPSSRRNPCIACGDTTGDCRTNEESGTVYCKNHQVPYGYEARGEAKDGLWLKSRPIREKEWKNVEKYVVQRRRPEKVVTETMPTDERHKWYSKIIEALPLLPEDKQRLRDRGMSDEEISAFGAFSYRPEQPLPFEVPKKLPGVITKGSKQFLPCEAAGIYFPVRDRNGKIHCLSIRFNEPIGKRRYGSASHAYAPFHVCNGEQPISVHFPIDCDPIGIGFCEGTGIKPFLAAQRTKRVIIGCSGADFSGNRGQISLTLKRLKTFPGLWPEPGCRLEDFILCYPDGGAQGNKHLVPKYERLFEMMAEFGEVINVAWWKQFRKTDGDIDELDLNQIKKIKVISPDDFLDFSSQQRVIQKRSMRFFGFWEDLKKDFQINPDTGFDHTVEYTGYAPLLDLSYRTTFLQGWLGSGKTETMLRSLDKNQTILWVSPRNGLLRQTAERAENLGFTTYHLQDDNSNHRWFLEANQPGMYFCAPDSLKDYAVGKVNWENITVVIDEFNGSRREMLSKRQELPQILSMLKGCKTLVCADAFLGDIDCKLVGLLRKGSTQLVHQLKKQSPTKIKWMETPRAEDGQISFDHTGLPFTLLQQWIDEGFQKTAIATDSLMTANILYQWLTEKGIKTHLVSSRTVEDNAFFLPNPDDHLAKEEIQCLIYTPTAQSGLDIQTSFARGLLACHGVLPPTQMLQMLGRCRQCSEWYISAPRRSLDPNVITKSLDRNFLMEATRKIRIAFHDLDYGTEGSTQGWALWEASVRDVEKAFNSEYLYNLLTEYFARIETITVERNLIQLESELVTPVTLWRKMVKDAKNLEAFNIASANLKHGLEMLDQRKAPTKDSDVWDSMLAAQYQKDPKIIGHAISLNAKISNLEPPDLPEILEDGGDLIQAVQDAIGDQDQLLEAINLLTSSRMEKIRLCMKAMENNPEDRLYLEERLKTGPTHWESKDLKELQNITLFNSLNLNDLAKMTSIKDINRETGFNVDSPEIISRWKIFEQDLDLRKLFPLCENRGDLWKQILKTMRDLGYESASRSLRNQSDSLHPNGRNAKGDPVFTRSKGYRFIGWVMMPMSGNDFFRTNFHIIEESIAEYLDRQRKQRAEARKRKEESQVTELPSYAELRSYEGEGKQKSPPP